MRRAFNFIFGAVIGALVGAGLAVLLAPSSGEELRGEMRTRLDRFRVELQEAAQDRRAELESQLQSMRRPEAESQTEDK